MKKVTETFSNTEYVNQNVSGFSVHFLGVNRSITRVTKKTIAKEGRARNLKGVLK
jgi:hypothetical protein